MPKLSDAFPSPYLKADVDVPDLEDGSLDVTITGAKIEKMGQGAKQEDKVVLYFAETKKGLVLNKTNWSTIATVLGSDDTDDWEGQRISLYAKDVEFQGEMIRGIRVKTRKPKPADPSKKAAFQTAKGAVDLPDAATEEVSADVPF
jgi:hypothetical protein